MTKYKTMPRKSDADAVTETIVSALPTIQARTLSLLGRRPRRIPRAEEGAVADKCRRVALELFARIGELQTINAEKEPAKIGAILEDLLSNLLRIGGIRRKRGEDLLDFLTRFAFKQSEPPRHPWTKRPEYTNTRLALWKFLVHQHGRLGDATLRAAYEKWAEVEGEGHISFLRQLGTAAKRFRSRPPVRLTDGLSVDLRSEYAIVSAFFEQRLRFLTYLARDGTAQAKPWSEWKKVNLNNLLAMAKTDPNLATLVGHIDRNVRNALAHGVPTIDMVIAGFVFADTNQSIRWTPTEFFERTRSLTVRCTALASFETLLSFAQHYCLIAALRTLRTAPTNRHSQ